MIDSLCIKSLAWLRTIARKLLQLYSGFKVLTPTLFRNYATFVEKELEVPTFCDVHIDLPYHVNVKPLNVHKYHNCDKLIIEVDEKYEQSLEYDINGNQVKIFDNITEKGQNILCSVKAPVKANLYINANKDIGVGQFHGDKLHIKSCSGNIFVDKFQGNSVNVRTKNGNIHFKDLIQASNITAEVLEYGSISTGRLQGLNLSLRAKKGNIYVESSYSYESLFDIESGNLDLNNIHKSCKIHVKDGNITLTGLDGKLTTMLENGSADIHLARISKDSAINILNGTLNLKISDACQDYIRFKIEAKDCDISENLKSTKSYINQLTILTPDTNEENTVFVSCLNGPVHIESASWQDMIRLKLKNKACQAQP